MRALTFLLLLSIGHGLSAGGIESVRLRAETERSRVVFDLQDAVTYRAFQMKNPARIVIDFQNIAYPKSLSLPVGNDGDDSFAVLKRMRYAVRNEKGLRIVLDLNDGVDLQHTMLPPRQDYGHRLVVDLYRKDSNRTQLPTSTAETKAKQTVVADATKLETKKIGERAAESAQTIVPPPEIATNGDNGARALALLNGKKDAAGNESSMAPKESGAPAGKSPERRTVSTTVDSAPKQARAKSTELAKSPDTLKPPRNVVVAIDAGHGGHDVGAIGPKGTYEKNIVLQISRELAATINKQPGMRAILTRSSDHYVGLRDRMQRARQQEADLFISIHADAFKDRRVSGSSVYVLSQHGASSEAARWLAENENAADLVGGVSLGDKDDVVKSVLIDLSQTASIDASIDAADTVLAALKKIGKVHKPTVQHAGFMVLKSPDIPSLLVETAFISNPTEEAKLRSKRYQRKLARALTDGVMRYFNQNPLPDTRFADNYQRQHKVNNGDTLSEIAERYAVSMESIKLANEMSRDRVRAGEILTIP